MLVEANDWDGIQTATKDLKAKVELEAMKAQVKADIKQDISQALNQTASDNTEISPTLSKGTSSLATAGTTSLTMPFVETMVVTARATNT